MSKFNLDPMLSPKSIAIIGASGDPSKISYNPVANLKRIGYEGKVYLVNAKYKEVAGFPCYPTIESLPDGIDVALIAVGASQVYSIVEQLHRKKVKSVVVLSAGFSEIGDEGTLLEEKLTEFSVVNNLPICGPNCLGITNFKEKTIVSFSTLKEGNYDPIAFITQSGAIGSLTYTMAQESGLGYQYFVSSGNEASVDFFDYVDYFANQPDIKVIGGYLEGARDFDKLKIAVKTLRDNRKPLVLMKVGNSSKGAEAASSHTASLAGNASVYEHYLKQNNIVRAENEEELIDTLNVFTKTKRAPKTGGLAIVTQSGGAGIIIADRCEIKGISIAELSEETKEKLRGKLSKLATVNNPIDLTAQASQFPNQIIESTEIALQDDAVEAVMVYIQMTDGRFVSILEDLARLSRNTDKMLVLCWSGVQPETKNEILKYHDICWINNPTRATNAIANVMKYYDRERQENEIESLAVEQIPATTQSYKQFIRGTLNEWDSKNILKKYKISVPNGTVIQNEYELEEINLNFPLVLKGVSSEIAHKSDYGLVQLNIQSKEEAQDAFKLIYRNASEKNVEHLLEGVLIEEMCDKGIEVIIGVTKDPVFGPCIMFGLGGIFVEILKDVVIMPAPLTKSVAENMVKSIKSYPLLQGARGSNASDIDALVETLVKVSQLCIENSEEIVEFEINPLIVHEKGKGTTAVDALLVGQNEVALQQ